jgi:hypothetical protein
MAPGTDFLLVSVRPSPSTLSVKQPSEVHLGVVVAVEDEVVERIDVPLVDVDVDVIVDFVDEELVGFVVEDEEEFVLVWIEVVLLEVVSKILDVCVEDEDEVEVL